MKHDTVAIKLDGHAFDVPRFSLEQHWKFTRCLSGDLADVPFHTIKIALEHVQNAPELHPTLSELTDAVNAVLVFNGYKQVSAEAPKN